MGLRVWRVWMCYLSGELLVFVFVYLGRGRCEVVLYLLVD